MMAFSEATKKEVRRKSHHACCLCKTMYVEIHHLISQKEGGSDTEENAAPLCPTCHETFGANPTEQKFIREARDMWYEICATRYSGDPDSIKEIKSKLNEVATKEDIERLVLKVSGQNNPFPWQHFKYSFEREDFVHPLIVRELHGLLSDVGQAITSVDIGLANRSNQFHGEFTVEEREGRPWVVWRGEKRGNSRREWFGYSFVGASPSGVQIVEFYESGGGSGVFGSVELLCFEQDRCLNCNSSQAQPVRYRVILKILGSIVLGDRYKGSIQYEDGKLTIGPDVGWFNRGEEACKELLIE